MPTLAPHSDAQRNAIDALLSRSSPWPLTEPGPDAATLDLVFAAAMRAPDHAQMRPWRFILIQDEARSALGDVFAHAARSRDPQDDGERFRAKAMAAPVLVAIAAHIEPSRKVPEVEQLLAVGAAVMNMLNALHILGFGGFWATGANTYDERVHAALGLGTKDRMLGFLYMGTPRNQTLPPTRPSAHGFVREWQPTGTRASAARAS